MTATFYGVLGVGPDADDDRIRRAFRERVKECHPDVSADPDAETAFKRLNTAKEVLLDGSERTRYDRLGHASYVRRHVDCSAWTEVTDAGTDVTDAGTDERASASGASGESTSSTATAAAPGTATAGSRTGGGGRAAPGDECHRARRQTGGAGRRARASEPQESSRAAGTAGSQPPAGERRRRRSAAASYAEGNFWQVHGTGTASVSRRGRPLGVRVLDVVRSLGAWLFVHAVFLAVAVATAWFVSARVVAGATVSFPVLFLLVAEVGIAVVLVVMHSVSLIYR